MSAVRGAPTSPRVGAPLFLLVLGLRDRSPTPVGAGRRAEYYQDSSAPHCSLVRRTQLRLGSSAPIRRAEPTPRYDQCLGATASRASARASLTSATSGNGWHSSGREPTVSLASNVDASNTGRKICPTAHAQLESTRPWVGIVGARRFATCWRRQTGRASAPKNCSVSF